jgi:hypothetical protein
MLSLSVGGGRSCATPTRLWVTLARPAGWRVTPSG